MGLHWVIILRSILVRSNITFAVERASLNYIKILSRLKRPQREVNETHIRF
jgi:hypothetical protein